jgi:hypothetical protein
MTERLMAWFRNHYICAQCKGEWDDEWSCMCDDDCPHCGARHMSPEDSDDLTKIITFDGQEYVLLESPESAGHGPNYREVARVRSDRQALAFLKG